MLALKKLGAESTSDSQTRYRFWGPAPKLTTAAAVNQKTATKAPSTAHSKYRENPDSAREIVCGIGGMLFAD